MVKERKGRRREVGVTDEGDSVEPGAWTADERILPGEGRVGKRADRRARSGQAGIGASMVTIGTAYGLKTRTLGRKLRKR